MQLLGLLGTNEIILLMLFFILLIGLIPMVFFLLTLQNTLKAIQPRNRAMQPGEVWLTLIPLFGAVWQFIVVSRIADSIEREIATENTFSFEQDPNYPTGSYGSKPTHNIGIAYCVLFCCGIIPLIGWLSTLAGLVCWIIYWVQVSEYKNRIMRKNYATGGYQG